MAKSKQPDAEPLPDVEVGDEVYFRHPEGGPKAGKIAAHGKHGCHIDCDGRRLKVRWEHMLGHKVRLQPDYSVVDEGEDGMIVQEPRGRRRYIHDPDSPSADIQKSAMPLALIFGHGDDLMKAIKNRPGLALQTVTDKAGHQTKRWKRTSKDARKAREKAAPDAGAKHGFGTHNLSEGDHVSFSANGSKREGEIVGTPGKDGAHVKDSAGQVHQVLWRQVTGHKPGDGVKKPPVEHEVRGKQEPVPPDQFKASDYAKSHDDAKVTPDAILAQFPPDTGGKIKVTQERLAALEQTIDRFKQDGEWLASRRQVHDKILRTILSPERMRAARAKPGEQPTFTMLGGRGGSGKSWFKGKVYDPDKVIVLDADEIKGMLPEYEGWNAAQIHEESGEILESIIDLCRASKMSVVLDATMKSAGSAVKRVEAFKKAGFRIEAHYMHLPRQEAAKRAVQRFLGETQRYVPVEVVLANTSNESTFDQVRQHADTWSFRDNNVPRGDEPIMISESGAKATGKDLKKATGKSKNKP